MTIYVSIIYRFSIVDYRLLDSDLYISNEPDSIIYYLYKNYLENKLGDNKLGGRLEKYPNLAKYKGEDHLCETRCFDTTDGTYEVNTFKINMIDN